MREDFNNNVKFLLARRVAFRCCNSDCRKITSGPQTDPKKALNIGVAAHITAAAPKGPRYDPSITSEERRSDSNGIWLCHNCAKLIDNDEKRYTIDLLRDWKEQAERAALREIEKPSSTDRISISPDQLDDKLKTTFYLFLEHVLARLKKISPEELLALMPEELSVSHKTFVTDDLLGPMRNWLIAIFDAFQLQVSVRLRELEGEIVYDKQAREFHLNSIRRLAEIGLLEFPDCIGVIAEAVGAKGIVHRLAMFRFQLLRISDKMSNGKDLNNQEAIKVARALMSEVYEQLLDLAEEFSK